MKQAVRVHLVARLQISGDINPPPLCLHYVGRDNLVLQMNIRGNVRRKIRTLFGIRIKGYSLVVYVATLHRGLLFVLKPS